MIYNGRAVFVGADGSMGFEHGRGYKIKVRKKRWWSWYSKLPGNIILTAETAPFLRERFCPYSSMEKLEENWELER